MSNPELDVFFTEQVTRKRPVDSSSEDGENTPDWTDVVTSIPCSLQPKSAQLGEKPYGVVPEAQMVAFFHPDADIKQNDLVLVEAGWYADNRYWVRRADNEFGDHIIAELEFTEKTPDAE